MYTILAISGSLRKDSYNTHVLKNAMQLAPGDVQIELVSIGNLPLFNQDLEENLPQEVVAFKQKVEQADAILFASPEYNYAISGVLKNVLDWGSRPYGKNSWKKKVAGLTGATEGNFGTGRAYYDVIKLLYGIGMIVIPGSEVLIANVDQKLDSNGKLIDEKTKEKIKNLLLLMKEWIEKFH